MRARTALIMSFSIASGVLVGALAGGTIDLFLLPYGASFGAIVGLFCSPILIAALWRRPLLLATCMILPPAMVTAIIAGQSGEVGTTLLSVVVFIGMACIAGQLLPELPLRIREGCCRECRYELGDLPCCPECGTPAGFDPSLPLPSPPSRARRLAWAIALMITTVMLPMAAASHAAWDRHRPRTTAELIEMLGDNDIRIQAEARRALRPLGAPVMIEAMQHSDPQVRRRAAKALGEIRDPSAREALEAALTDPDRNVQHEALSALRALGAR